MDPTNEPQPSGSEFAPESAASPTNEASDYMSEAFASSAEPEPAPVETPAEPAAVETPAPGTPPAPTEQTAAPDPWQTELDKVKAAAKAAGFDTPEAYRAAQQAAIAAQTEERQWETRTHAEIVSDLRAKVDAGEITEAQAHAQYEQRFAEAEAARETERAEAKQTEEQLARAIELETREAHIAYADAVKGNPLLSAGDDVARDLFTALTTSGVAKASEVLPMFNALVNAVAERATAEKAVKEVEPPILSPGSQTPASTGDDEPGGFFNWTNQLLRDAGIK